MLRLREAFSQKIHFHIRQDMLQRLWDKYVPSDSAEYGDIQLIYLGQEAAQPEEQSQKIQLLISLVLRNRIMRMGLDKAPIKTALVREQMKSSSQRMEKYYLMQLKCCDFVMYRKVCRYVGLIDQAEAEDRRYRNWQKESQAIEKQREEYRLFSLFSSEMKEFLKERSYEAMRAVERDILYVLSEKEYHKLAERLIWQERETFLSCLEKCDKVQYNKILKRLEKSSKELSIKLFQSWVKGQGMEAVRALDSHEYMLFYQRAVSVINEEAADRQLVVWKKNKEKMLRYVKRQEPEKILYLLRQMEQFAEETSSVSVENMAQFTAVFNEKFTQLEEQYFQQVIKELREQAASVLNDRTYQAIAQRAQHFLWEETAEKPVGENRLPAGEERHRGESRFLTVGVSRIAERIEQELTLKQERLKERQAQIFVTYQNAYREVLGTINRALQEQYDVLQFNKEIFSAQYKGKLVKEIFQSQHRGEFSEEEIERICELGRVFAEPIATEEGQEITGERFTLSWHTDEREVQGIQQAIADIREQKEEKQSEFIGNLAEAMFIWEQVHVSARQISRMVEELSGKVSFSQNAQGRVEEGQIQLIGEKITEFSLLQRTEENQAAEQIQLIGEKIMEFSLLQRTEENQAAEQIQLIGRKITESFLQGTEGEREKGQIQIPGKKLQKIISQRIKGEQGNTYIQITEEKIKDFYLKKIEEKQKETIRKSGEQRLERIFTKIPEKVVEEIFQSQHRGEFSEEEIERICELGRVFAEPIAIEEGQGITGERLALPRHTDKHETQKVQQAISYLQELEEEKQSEFIGNLAEAMFIWEQVHVSAQQISRMVEELSGQAPFAQDVWGRVEERQIQLIGRKITESFLHGIEGEQGKGQIQIPEKKIQQIISRHIEGEQGETYIQITEKKIREFYLKNIEENHKEIIRKSEEQRLGLTFTQVLEKVVEEIFQSQHRGEFGEEEIERICELGRVFAEPIAIEEGQGITGERLALPRHTDKHETQKVQQAISYLQELEEEKQSEFIGNLAEAVFIWEQAHVSAQQISQTVEELSGQVSFSQSAQGRVEEGQILQMGSKIKEILLQKIDKAKTVHVPYSKLWEWGRALLFYQKLPVSGNVRLEEMHDLVNEQQERGSDTDNPQQEDVQTDIIRRQIEAAKDKNSLRQLIVQINHQASSRQKTQENILVYADSQLHAQPVQDLIRYLRELDERQYGEFVRQMSQVMEIQRQLHTALEKIKGDAKNPWEGAQIHYLQPQGNAEKMQEEAENRYLQPQGSAEKMQEEAENRYLQPQGSAEKIQGKAEIRYLQPQGSAANPQTETGRIAVWQKQDSQRLAAAYPELAVRIREFERQRRQLTQKRMQAARQEFFHQPHQQNPAPQAADTGEPDLWQTMLSINEPELLGAALPLNDRNSPDFRVVLEGGKDVLAAREKEIRAWELQYSMQNAYVSDEEQQKDKMRMHEETIQMKSAQEQLGKKLQEVETQLKKVETAAKAKEDVRAFADQVKQQLYEELHVEKLRRGLI